MKNPTPIWKSPDYLQKMLNEIYGKRNRHMYSSTDLLLHVFEEASAVAEEARKEDADKIKYPTVRLFAWLVAFCNQEGLNIAEATFSKYHGLCPYCGRKKNCICISTEAKPAVWFKDPSAKKPVRCSEWQEMFSRIYGNVNKVAGREKAWDHVLEELGELSRAYRLNRKKDMRAELADTFAWFIAFCNHLHIDLFEWVMRVYDHQCDVCKKEKCRCPKV